MFGFKGGPGFRATKALEHFDKLLADARDGDRNAMIELVHLSEAKSSVDHWLKVAIKDLLPLAGIKAADNALSALRQIDLASDIYDYALWPHFLVDAAKARGCFQEREQR